MEVYDFNRNLRAMIDDDGAVKSAKGGVIGFINGDGQCGDVYALSRPSPDRPPSD